MAERLRTIYPPQHQRGKSLLTRFLERVRYTFDRADCWPWIGSIDREGYGRFGPDGYRYAHRWSYRLAHGQIPDGLVIDHLCRNRACCNPWHLEAVTPKVNFERGLVALRRDNPRSKCSFGHSMADAYVCSNGARQCRACGRARALASWRKRSRML